jgi:hypothetical protein
MEAAIRRLKAQLSGEMQIGGLDTTELPLHRGCRPPMRWGPLGQKERDKAMVGILAGKSALVTGGASGIGRAGI